MRRGGQSAQEVRREDASLTRASGVAQREGEADREGEDRAVPRTDQPPQRQEANGGRAAVLSLPLDAKAPIRPLLPTRVRRPRVEGPRRGECEPCVQQHRAGNGTADGPLA